MKTNDFKNLDIGESKNTGNYSIVRVPGGWIYSDSNGVCFIPYINM